MHVNLSNDKVVKGLVKVVKRLVKVVKKTLRSSASAMAMSAGSAARAGARGGAVQICWASLPTLAATKGRAWC